MTNVEGSVTVTNENMQLLLLVPVTQLLLYVSSSWKCECWSRRNYDNYDLFLSKTVLAYAKTWHHVDASGRTLGKLAQRIATVLMGKHKPIYDPGGMFLLAVRMY